MVPAPRVEALVGGDLLILVLEHLDLKLQIQKSH